ncbi:hypothetical protein LEP1GSC125_1219 [Leptospira mayottensis 200901122]|uniref:Uncharacterized protein n=1 Tax=Leptospira mayottensis 200901122 TaxID=1193010 RepID=A0AA87MSQ6_9LEPT|nr:hypothetical protein LEP1GSC125_1219 [Leptospira mayottensis 200901122]
MSLPLWICHVWNIVLKLLIEKACSKNFRMQAHRSQVRLKIRLYSVSNRAGMDVPALFS